MADEGAEEEGFVQVFIEIVVTYSPTVMPYTVEPFSRLFVGENRFLLVPQASEEAGWLLYPGCPKISSLNKNTYQCKGKEK